MKKPMTFSDIQTLTKELKDEPVKELEILAMGMDRLTCTYFILILHDTYGIQLNI